MALSPVRPPRRLPATKCHLRCAQSLQALAERSTALGFAAGAAKVRQVVAAAWLGEDGKPPLFKSGETKRTPINTGGGA